MGSVEDSKMIGNHCQECESGGNIGGSRIGKRKKSEKETFTHATAAAKLENGVAPSPSPCNQMCSCAVRLPDASWSFEGKLVRPQHVCKQVCYACGKNQGSRWWHCQKCSIATHENCIPYPEVTTLFHNRPGRTICWRHASDVDYKLKVPSWDYHVSFLHQVCSFRPRLLLDIFCHLPVPEIQQEFSLTSQFIKEVMENDKEPPPYFYVRRNVFLIKKKRDDADDGVGCSCKSSEDVCRDDCECRVQSMSCSKACNCNHIQCNNKPFRKPKRLKVIKTVYCGWGAFAAEAIKKDEFIIEYTGEVINDAMCEKRLWEMKGRQSISNFYMCEIAKDFIIDATRKGNASRYLNHSCQPNCKLEKWRVDGETRVGVFARKNIAAGEELNYDYKYVEFGPNVTCRCGSLNCRGAIGEKFNAHRKSKISPPKNWGSHHKRSFVAQRR